MLDRIAPPWNENRVALLVWVIALIGILGSFAFINGSEIARYPPVSRDEIWVLSASVKLAETGTLGSDMFRGFHGADEHFFIALPGYELLQALVFRVVGPSLVAARAVSLASGMIVIAGVGWLGLRWFGAAAGTLAMLLVAYWQTGLLGYASGLPLTTVANTGRYDASALALTTLAVVLLDLTITSRRLWLAVACGLACGLATLTQFFGVLSLGLALGTMLLSTRTRLWRPPLLAGVAGGFACVVLPYFSWVALHLENFRGQAVLKEGRTDFFSVSFYLSNLADERLRYRGLWQTEGDLERVAAALFIALFPAALGLLSWRAWHERRRGDLLLLGWCGIGMLGIALLDGTNAGLYAIVVWPPAVLAVAAMLTMVLRGILQAERRLVTITAAGLLSAIMALALQPGLRTQADVPRDASQTTSYADLGDALDGAVPRDATVIGSERWWWPLRERDYLALTNLWQQWLALNEAGNDVTFTDVMARNGATLLLTDDVIWGDLINYGSPLADEVRRWIDDCAELVWSTPGGIYGDLQLFRLREDVCA